MLLSAGFLAVMVAGALTGAIVLRNQEQMSWVSHTYEVERDVAAIRLSLEQMRSSRRAAVIGIRVDKDAAYGPARDRLFQNIARVQALTVDNPLQQENIARLKTQAKTLDQLFLSSMRAGTLRKLGDEESRQRAASAVQRTAEMMLGEERRLAVIRNEAVQTSVRLSYAVLPVTGLLLLVVAIGSVLIIRRYTTELSQSRDQLQGMNENLESAVQVRTIDLQRANDEIQRFAYIVSHDLRSPLVNVMGFTAEVEASLKPMAELLRRLDETSPELVTEDARLAVREDLPEAVGFIRSSTQKMDRLINAILRLSREGRRSITPERIELNAVAQNVVDTLRHRIDELGVGVEIAPHLPAITTDRLAIEQILSNLVENAVKYLQPGRPGLIQISGQIRFGRAMISVADNGRGIEARDHERIFDLFRRSGEQDQPGEGIGLAHVRALAYRLGGTITVESQFGQGTTFTVNLPVQFSGSRGSAE